MKLYDILELMKMELGELYNIALWYSIDFVGMHKQDLIYKILDKQQQNERTDRTLPQG
jgi:uncharacterized protein YqgQ